MLAKDEDMALSHAHYAELEAPRGPEVSGWNTVWGGMLGLGENGGHGAGPAPAMSMYTRRTFTTTSNGVTVTETTTRNDNGETEVCT
jgi:hypothetical protein